MTKSDLIKNIAKKHPNISKSHIEFMVNHLFTSIKESLKKGENVEIRGFGSFRIREKLSKTARNPRTGLQITVPARKIPYFRPGQEIKTKLSSIK